LRRWQRLPRIYAARFVVLVLWSALLLTGGSAFAQSQPTERNFKKPAPEVEKAIQALHASSSGHLPILDGFVDSDQNLDRYERGFYQCVIQATPGAGGGTVVRVTAKITAWLNDPNPAQAGYKKLASNGRLESDYLDRLEAQLGAKGTVANRASGGAGASRSAPPADTTANADGPGKADVMAPTTATRSAEDTAAPVSIAPTESVESIRRRADADERQMQQLNTFLQNLEQIKQTQTHPSDLAVVKKSATPILSQPEQDASVLFSAEAEDEFQILDLNKSWVHVQISGASRGWVRRAFVDLPAGFAPSGAAASENNAPADPDALFQVTREETNTFAGDWAPLKGKPVKLIWVTPNSAQEQLTSPQAKRNFAKALLIQQASVEKAVPNAAGIVIVFDSADGGQISATLAHVKELIAGTVSEPDFWKECSLDPPDAFEDSARK
jgi:hypothetical protein